MELYIAEKPSLARGIAAHLGTITQKGDGFLEIDGGRCIMTWCIGHIFEQAGIDDYLGDQVPLKTYTKNGKEVTCKQWRREDLPVIPKQWLLKTTNARQFSIIKQWIKKSSSIVNCGDPDREGQLLVDEVMIEAGVSPDADNVSRIWLSALDDDSIKKALANLKPNSDYRNLRASALSRARADWLIGLNGTRAFTLASGGLVTVGRVQTPTLALVVRRDELIQNFKTVDFFVPYVVMKDGTKLDWVGCLNADRIGLDTEGRIITPVLANKIVTSIQSGLTWSVTHSVSQKEKEKPPLPHSLDSLQIYLSKTKKMTAKTTLDACQSLYEEHKMTTYPRSDCRYLPTSMQADSTKILKGIEPLFRQEVMGAHLDLKSAAWNDAKITAHHAIIPTGQPPKNNLNEAEKSAFDAISRFYLAQFYPAAEFTKTDLELLFGEEDRFRTSEKFLLSPGWKSVINEGLVSDEEKDSSDV